MIRPDWHIVEEWITPRSRVLDLGCGDGALLDHLLGTRQVAGVGLELEDEQVAACIERGLNVIQELPSSFAFTVTSTSSSVCTLSGILKLVSTNGYTLIESCCLNSLPVSSVTVAVSIYSPLSMNRILPPSFDNEPSIKSL